MTVGDAGSQNKTEASQSVLQQNNIRHISFVNVLQDLVVALIYPCKTICHVYTRIRGQFCVYITFIFSNFGLQSRPVICFIYYNIFVGYNDGLKP